MSLSRKKSLNGILLIVFFCICFGFTYAYAATSAATDTNNAFSFDIAAPVPFGGDATHTRFKTPRERATKITANTWKVQLKKSDETVSSNTATSFTLQRKDKVGGIAPFQYCSKLVTVTEGKAASYIVPKSSANQTVVYLIGTDNDGGGHAYHISGYWDEETGVMG